MATSRSTSKSQAGGSGTNGAAKRTSSRSATAKGVTAKAATSKANGNGTAAAGTNGGRRRVRTSEASATGMTTRARISAATRKGRTTNARRAKAQPDQSVAAGTVPATDEVLAASNAKQALSADMPRVAWLRQQLQNLETERRERLVKVVQLTLIAIVFITFVLQNSQGVNVHFLLFSLNIRLIWVIFGCGLLGAFGGYLLGRPEKSLRALLPQKEKPASRRTTTRSSTKA